MDPQSEIKNGHVVRSPELERRVKIFQQWYDGHGGIVVQYNVEDGRLGEMCSTIAHEIRNPLVSIGGFARRLQRLLPNDGTENRYTQTIVLEVARVEKILNDFMNYTSGESSQFRTCDLRQLLDESLSMMTEGFENGIQLVKEFAEDLPKVKGDYQQLKQAFFNLIDNAVKYSPGSTTVWLDAHAEDRRVRISVRDRGVGIPERDRKHIFDKFYRVDGQISQKVKGAGLGLSLVKHIVAAHGGTVECESREGEGSTFSIWLPAQSPVAGGADDRASDWLPPLWRRPVARLLLWAHTIAPPR
jgi:signal transduction histidine kinase